MERSDEGREEIPLTTAATSRSFFVPTVWLAHA